MKDDKFQELVHLYLDGEIQPREFRRLTRELSRNPVRRDYFLQHCRLHRALSIALRKNQSQSLPSESQIYERISRKRARRARLPDWIGATAALILITFFVLPPAWVNSWLPGNLGHYAEDVRGGIELAVKDMQQALPLVTASEVPLAEVESEDLGFVAEVHALPQEVLDWAVDPWDENLGGQPWWEFRYPGLEWLSRMVEEEAFTGFSSRELRVVPIRSNPIR